MKTQVGIIGAGPAGLFLSHLLHLHGIHSVILEHRDYEYALSRVRAGLLDNDVCALIRATGVGENLDKYGIEQHQMEYRFDGNRAYINWYELTGRKTWIYGQQQLVQDLVERRQKDDAKLLWEAEALGINGLGSDTPSIRFRHKGEEQNLECDIVAGCDGFQGISRASIPSGKIKEFLRTYPFGWLGTMADVAPSSPWLVTASHDNGYAMHSMRSRYSDRDQELSRNYIQCDLNDTIEDWPDNRVWDELHTRLASNDGWELKEGRIIEKMVLPLRSFVCEPMQYRRLFLAGDSAHLVPPTGGRGLNQAIYDIACLADGIKAFFDSNSLAELEDYSATCLRRVWQAQYFSWRQTNMLQRHEYTDQYHRRLQLNEIAYMTTNKAAATHLAENYAGAPIKSHFLGNEVLDYPTV